MPQLHNLKTWPAPFEAVWDGRKTYEIRRDDRGFAVGDHLLLQEWDPATKTFSGRMILGEVTYMTPPGQWGLPDDLCILSVSVLNRCSTHS